MQVEGDIPRAKHFVAGTCCLGDRLNMNHVTVAVQVQSELHKSLQDQHDLLQHHFQSHAAQQMSLHGLAFNT